MSCDDVACSGPPETINTIDATVAGTQPSLALGADGNPTIAYFNGTNGQLRVIHCDDPVCAPGGEPPSTVDSAGVVGGFTSMVIKPGGNPGDHVLRLHQFAGEAGRVR